MSDNEDISTPNSDLLAHYVTMTPGDLVAKLTEVRDARRAVAARDKELVEEWRAAEAALMAVLDAQGTNKVGTPAGTATLTEDDVPLVKDWDTFLNDCRENDRLYLLQRRVATKAWKELKDNGFEVAGVETYKKRSISLRKA
jgi:hypothetical protein